MVTRASRARLDPKRICVQFRRRLRVGGLLCTTGLFISVEQLGTLPCHIPSKSSPAMRADRQQIDQALAATETIRSILREALLAVYLHGSAVSGGLRPQSDVDLLAIVDCPVADEQRRDLLAALLRISGRHPRAVGTPRCIELMVFLRADIATPNFPVRAEFIYANGCGKRLNPKNSLFPCPIRKIRWCLRRATRGRSTLRSRCKGVSALDSAGTSSPRHARCTPLIGRQSTGGRAERLANPCSHVAYIGHR